MKEKELTVLAVQTRLGKAGIGEPSFFPVPTVLHKSAGEIFNGLDTRTLVLSVQSPLVTDRPDLLRRAGWPGADEDKTLLPIIRIFRPAGLHESRSRNLKIRVSLAGEKTAIFHDPRGDGDPPSGVAVGREEIVEEVSSWLNFARMTNKEEPHQVSPSEGRQLGGSDSKMLK